MKSAGQVWTLIARFANNDTDNWMQDNGYWWYDLNSTIGTLDPWSSNDMISPAFWLASGSEFKVTRSDDPQHIPLLQTTGECLGNQTFRSKITAFGDFRNNGSVWASDQCLGNCTVQYGGLYETTLGFSEAKCNGSIQSANQVGFWCDFGHGEGSVIMIGGGGSECSRADHGIAVTNADEASFFDSGEGEADFGDDGDDPVNNTYSLSLWIG